LFNKQLHHLIYKHGVTLIFREDFGAMQQDIFLFDDCTYITAYRVAVYMHIQRTHKIETCIRRSAKYSSASPLQIATTFHQQEQQWHYPVLLSFF
jgi:hypothetical protein